MTSPVGGDTYLVMERPDGLGFNLDSGFEVYESGCLRLRV